MKGENNALMRILRASHTDTEEQLDMAIALLEGAHDRRSLITAAMAAENATSAAKNHFVLERRIAHALAAAA